MAPPNSVAISTSRGFSVSGVTVFAMNAHPSAAAFSAGGNPPGK
ncbi:MAG TPA: hypothetical protein VFF65_05960 [Phycisphaerales bacterium]|nr:hypothetical protein [Phycisphaerales bacterium]